MKGKTYHVISCQPSPQGILAKGLQEALNKLNPERKILVTEDGGTPAIASLKKKDPFRNPRCRFGMEECMVENGRDCATQGIIYEISCKECNQSIQNPITSRGPGSWPTHNYIGMTRCSAHYRMELHMKGQRSKDTGNPLYRHDRDVHDGVVQTYQTRILASEKNLLPLCIMEGLYIEKQNYSMNDKNEFGRGSLIRVTASRIT